MSLNPDLLRIEFLGVTLRHYQVDLPREDLAIFFASVGERYGLSRLEFNADAGATFSGPDGAECSLRSTQITSCGVTGMGYREGLERVVGLVGEAAERYGLGELWIEDVTLVAIWDAGDPEAARGLLVNDVLRMEDDRLVGDLRAIGADFDPDTRARARTPTPPTPRAGRMIVATSSPTQSGKRCGRIRRCISAAISTSRRSAM